MVVGLGDCNMANNTKKLSRLIDTVDVLGTEMRVEFLPEVIHEDGTDCLGLMYAGRNLIQILDTDEIPYESQLSTLLHECIEAMVAKIEMDVEHRDISALETAFFQLMRHNPELCKAFSLYQPRGSK